MSLSAERFDAAACRFAGFQPRFQCFLCDRPVTEAAVFHALDLIRTVRFYLHCHNRSTMIDLPMEFFMKVPDWRRVGIPEGSFALPFVVGFEGTWGIRLRNYDWLLQSPHSFYTAVGTFRQEQLRLLFGSTYTLDSEFFNIVNTEHDLEFPAQFWFPSAKQCISLNRAVFAFDTSPQAVE